MTRFFLALLLSVFALLVGEGQVRADELKAKAQSLLSEGNNLAAEGDFGNALVKFRTAYELYPSPKLLLNIGTSLRQIGRNAEAVETYERYLAHPEADPQREDELRDILDELEDLVGTIEIQLEESRARVSLDGKILRDFSSGDRVRVDPGDHTVTAELLGRPPAIQHVTVKAKQSLTVTLSLDKPPEVVPEGPDAREVIGYTLVGIGGAAIIVGAVLGGIALSTQSDADELCDEEGEFAGFCSAEGADLMKSARTEGVASTAVFISGFAVLVSGFAIAISVLADDDEGEVEVGVGPGSLSVRGTF